MAERDVASREREAREPESFRETKERERQKKRKREETDSPHFEIKATKSSAPVSAAC